MTVKAQDFAEGRFYLGKDGKVVRQIDFLWSSELVSYREFDAKKGHPISFHHTCHTEAFLDLTDRVMHPSETGYLQVAEADRLQKLETERRWKQIIEHIPEDRLVGELGRRGYRVEPPPKRHPLTDHLTIHFQRKDDGEFESVGQMTEEQQRNIIKELREHAKRQGPLDPNALAQPLSLSMGGKLFHIHDRMCVLYFSLLRSGTTVEHLVVEPSGSREVPLADDLVKQVLKMVFRSEKGVVEVPVAKRPTTSRQFVRPLPIRVGARK